MISYFLEYVRSHFFLSTNILDDSFALALSKKAGIPQQEVDELLYLIENIRTGSATSDELVLQLNKRLNAFYTMVT